MKRKTAGILSLLYPPPWVFRYFSFPHHHGTGGPSSPALLINRLVITFDYGYYDYGDGDDDDNALYPNKNLYFDFVLRSKHTCGGNLDSIPERSSNVYLLSICEMDSSHFLCSNKLFSLYMIMISLDLLFIGVFFLPFILY